MKRTLSPPLPSNSKRFHAIGRCEMKAPLPFNDFLYDELILAIFSHLSWVDLCSVQATCKEWCRLASDNELWRKLYITVFGRARLRGSRGYSMRSNWREIKPLPSRVNPEPEPGRDWKWMFRISSNWKKGRCIIEELDTTSSSLDSSTQKSSCETHVILSGSLIITASSQPSEHPIISLITRAARHTLTCESRVREQPLYITTLAIDQSPPSKEQLRLSAFLSTGEFTVFSLIPSQLSASVRKLTYVPSRQRPKDYRITQAVYHHPLLISLSHDCSLSLYDLSAESVRHTQTLTSFSTFPPTSLVLSTPSSTTYKLVLAYTTPVYPAHWSVGATELIISGQKFTSPITNFHTKLSTSAGAYSSIEAFKVVSTRTARALDVPQGWVDEEKVRLIREQWGRKVPRVTETQTDGKWVVLASAEKTHIEPSSSSFTSSSRAINTPDSSSLDFSTTLQLYRLYLPSPSNSVAVSPPKLSFVRSLHGQAGPIASLALADGRCISFGLNGSLWVWDLETGSKTEVEKSGHSSNPEFYSKKRTVSFDERSIVTTEGSQVVIRRFDI